MKNILSQFVEGLCFRAKANSGHKLQLFSERFFVSNMFVTMETNRWNSLEIDNRYRVPTAPFKLILSIGEVLIFTRTYTVISKGRKGN